MKILRGESGRSMVEMLGVLAIIGVLSIVGIQGYKQAMNKIKANEIVQLANTYYVDKMTANGGSCVSVAAAAVSDAPKMLEGISMAISCDPSATVTVTGSVATTDVMTKVRQMGTSNPIVT